MPLRHLSVHEAEIRRRTTVTLYFGCIISLDVTTLSSEDDIPMKADLKPLRHEKEALYGTIVILLGALIWMFIAALFAVTIIHGGSLVHLYVLVAELAAFGLFIYISKLFYRAYLFGHAVLISERQFPHLYASLRAGATKLGLPTVPQAFVYNSNGLMNAFALRVSGTRMVMLTSALIDVESDAQVDFVIGHELGHHAAGHLSFWTNLLKLPGTFFPFLGPAYHRARELTADRIGAYCVGELEASRSALHMLACGSARLNAVMNGDAFAAQEHLVPGFTGFLLHIFSGYPRLTRRVTEVESYFRHLNPPDPMARLA